MCVNSVGEEWNEMELCIRRVSKVKETVSLNNAVKVMRCTSV